MSFIVQKIIVKYNRHFYPDIMTICIKCDIGWIFVYLSKLFKYFLAVKYDGFNEIRMPVNADDVVDTDGQITNKYLKNYSTG